MDDLKTDPLQVQNKIKILQFLTFLFASVLKIIFSIWKFLKKEKINRSVLSILVVIWITSWTAYHYFGRETFEIGQAIGLFSSFFALFILKPNWKISKIGFIVSTNALLDELFFDPFKISLNEYFCIGLIILFILFNNKINEVSNRIKV